MKKPFKSLMVLFLSLGLTLSSCNVAKTLEEDIQVILMDDGNYIGTYTVNIFNNAVVPEMENKVIGGDTYRFRGWSVIENWTEGVDSEDLLSANTGLIRYDDVKDYVPKGSSSITLYSAYSLIPKRDLVLAWYDRKTTSGIDQDYMDSYFVPAMNDFLISEGYDLDELDIEIRGYDGDVATSCGNIKKDGDVDIMFAWGANIGTTGGMTKGEDYIENNGGIPITDSLTRYCARCTDTDFCRLVYYWIFDFYGVPIEQMPKQDEDTEGQSEAEDIDYDLVIAWYDRSGTSGLDQTYIDNMSNDTYNYLSTKGYTDVNVAFRRYDGSVGESCGQIMSDGDVDIMYGWAATSNITGTGNMPTDMILDNQAVTILNGGSTYSRYCARLTDTDICNLVYKWIVNGFTEPDQDDEDIVYDLVIAWYSKTETSGIDDTYIENMSTDTYTYLSTKGYNDVDVLFRSYNGNVGDTCASIMSDSDVDIMYGWGSTDNLTSTGGMSNEMILDNQSVTITNGDTTKSRYCARLTDTDICNLVYKWIVNGFTEPEEEHEEQKDDEDTDYDLVIAWYNKVDTSGIDQTYISDTFTPALETYLTSQGYTVSNLSICYRGYEGNVATYCGNIVSDNDVDLMIGWGSNVTSNGISPLATQDGLTFGSTSGRYAHRLTDTDLSKLVFNWISEDSLFQPVVEEQEFPVTLTETKIVIAWYNLVDTSGMDETYINDTLKPALEAYLEENVTNYSELDVTLRGYEGDVSTSGAAINADGDVDVAIGWGANFQTTGGVSFIDRKSDLTFGSKSGRYVYRLTDTDISTLVYNWFCSAELFNPA